MQVKRKNDKAQHRKIRNNGKHMILIEEIKLNNGLILKIFDLSRSIAEDTVKVEIFFQANIFLKESFFANHEDYTLVKSIMGEELAYEHRLERTFVKKENEDLTRNELINTFRNNSLEYLSNANFAQKMALSKLREIKSDPYKYRSRIHSDANK